MHILSFQPEYILYFYMLSCVAVLLYNVAYIFYDKFRRNKKEGNKKRIIEELLACIQEEEIDEKRMVRRLSRLLPMLELEEGVEWLRQDKNIVPKLDHYCKALRPVFLRLTDQYAKKPEEEQAYFSYMVFFLKINEGQESSDGIVEYLLEQVMKKNVYCRENALKALYAIGNPEFICRAWTMMDRNRILHSSKLLSDGLLGFQGNKEKLALILWEGRKEYGSYLLLAVMQFIRFSTASFCNPFLELLRDERQDKELRLEAIRYLRRYPYEPARELLLSYVKYQELVDWEYAAMAALSLSAYPGRDTEYVLKTGLHSRNWYVRKNCARSLVEGLQLSYLQLADVLNGNDRYARESLIAMMDQQKIENQRMELVREDD